MSAAGASQDACTSGAKPRRAAAELANEAASVGEP